MKNYNEELEVSEHAWKHAVLAVKILDAVGNTPRPAQSPESLPAVLTREECCQGLGEEIPDAGGNPSELLHFRNEAERFLASDNRSRRTFALHLLRFLYKNGRFSVSSSANHRICVLLKSDPSPSVRLAAFDFLGAICARTHSKSGVEESDYSDILSFREEVLKRSAALRHYESSEAAADVALLLRDKDTRPLWDRVIANLR
jgi:hypothetical protein